MLRLWTRFIAYSLLLAGFLSVARAEDEKRPRRPDRFAIIFGPGKDWTPDCGKPGGVWCAQRIPDDEIGCSANRSRIGEVDLKDTDHFLASSNIHSLARELGFWTSGEPFVWHDVYGGPGSEYNSLREWRALSLAAPSLGLKVTGDPKKDRYPFSVKSDKLLSVRSLARIMRDADRELSRRKLPRKEAPARKSSMVTTRQIE